MPVQSNIAIQNSPRVLWTGSGTARSFDILKITRFAFAFEVTADLTADAVFNIEAAPGSEADPCVPGTFAPVPEVATCQGGAEAAQATVTIPSGTTAGTVCSGTIPCRPGRHVRLTPVTPADAANVLVAAVLQGPKM